MVKKLILVWVMGICFSMTGIYAQSNYGNCGKQKNYCYLPGDDYKHQFKELHHSGRGNIKIQDEINETSFINHNYKQQAGGNLSDPRTTYGIRPSRTVSDENLQGVILNNNYKQQAGGPILAPVRRIVIGEASRGC